MHSLSMLSYDNAKVSEDIGGRGRGGGRGEQRDKESFHWMAGGVVVSAYVAAECHPAAA